MSVRLELFRGDAVEVMSSMPSASVDMVFTNPPVGIVVDERCRTKELVTPPKVWLTEALRVSRGPVVWTISPDLFFKFPRALDPDLLLIWLIEKNSGYAAGKRGFASDYNLVCVHRPQGMRGGSSDVILARPGFPEPSRLVIEARKSGTTEALETRFTHPAPGSVALASHVCGLWKPKSILDPFCGVGATFYGGLAAGHDIVFNELEFFGIDIDGSYLTSLAHLFHIEWGATVVQHKGPQPTGGMDAVPTQADGRDGDSGEGDGGNLHADG